MSDEKKPEAVAQTRQQRQIEFTIELGDRLNSNHIWPINKKTLRGAWKNDNARHLALDTEGRYAAMRQMRDIPGTHIHVNTQRRTARIYDPLGEPSNKELLAHHVRIQEQTEGKKCGPDKVDLYSELTAEEIKTWLYWCRRKLDAQQACEVNGTVPAMGEILAMPGKIIRDTNDDALTDEQRYRPMTTQETGQLVAAYS